MSDDIADLITVEEAAVRLGCCSATVHNRVRRAGVTYARDGRRRFLREQDMQSLAELPETRGRKRKNGCTDKPKA